jgi:hypothetical protein
VCSRAFCAGGSSRALLDSGVFRALVVLLAAGHFLQIPELRYPPSIYRAPGRLINALKWRHFWHTATVAD